jgi:hypothetical protein
MENIKMNEELLNEINVDGSLDAINRIMEAYRSLKITDGQTYKLLNMNAETHEMITKNFQ